MVRYFGRWWCFSGTKRQLILDLMIPTLGLRFYPTDIRRYLLCRSARSSNMHVFVMGFVLSQFWTRYNASVLHKPTAEDEKVVCVGCFEEYRVFKFSDDPKELSWSCLVGIVGIIAAPKSLMSRVWRFDKTCCHCGIERAVRIDTAGGRFLSGWDAGFGWVFWMFR